MQQAETGYMSHLVKSLVAMTTDLSSTIYPGLGPKGGAISEGWEGIHRRGSTI